MNQPLTPEQARKIAASAGLVFEAHRGFLSHEQQQSVTRDLQILQDPRLPSDKIPDTLAHVRSALRFLLARPGVDVGALNYCEKAINDLIGSERPTPPQGQGTQVPRRPSPPPSQALPSRIPSGQTTVPHREVMAIPRPSAEDAGEMTMAFDVVMPTSEQPPKHETVVLPEKSPPAREPKKAKKTQPPEKTRRDASPSPEARRKSPPPRAQSSAPHGLISEEADISPVATPRPAALPALSVREELGRTHYKTMPIPPAVTLAAPPPTPEIAPPLAGTPQVYRTLFALATAVVTHHRSIEDLVAELHRSGVLTFDDQGRASAAHLDLCKYLNEKTDYSAVDELISDALANELQQLEKGISPRFKELIRRQQLGYLGTTAAPELREKGVELTKRIGAGGMGAVLLGHQLEEDRDVAVKIVTQPGRNPRREVQVAAKFDQKDPVVLVYAGGLIENYPYSVMAYLPGVRDLHDLPRSLGIEPRLVACMGMAKSVRAMHSKKVLHKDIKPANFLTRNLKNGDLATLLQEIEVYGSDFGLARPFDAPELDDPNAIEGTPFFMSPEQASLKTLTPASDVFSVGISMYNVLTGEMPYDMKEVTTQGQLLNHIRTLKSSPIKRNDKRLKEVPAELVDVLVRMTHPKPEKRPSAEEAEKAFEKYFSGEQNKWTKRAFWGLGGAAALAVAGALISMPIIGKSNRRDEFQKTQAQALRSAEEAVTERNWQNAITLLEAEESRIITNEDLSGSERQAQLENVRERLRTAREGLQTQQREQREAAQRVEQERGEAAIRADRLISEGDALLAQQNFSGARAKYDQALAASAERAEQVRERRNRADREEITVVFAQGVRSYHTGELGSAAEAFRRLDDQRLSPGLSADQRARIAEMRRAADEWNDAKRAELSNEVVRLGDLASLQAAEVARLQLQHLPSNDERLVRATRALEISTRSFLTSLQQLQTRAQGGNRDAYSIILELYRYLGENVPAIVAEQLRQNAASPDSVSDEQRNHPEVVTYNAKSEAVRLAINTLAVGRREDRRLLLYPGSEMRFQFAHGQEIVLQQSEVTLFLDRRDWPNAQIAVMTMVQIMDLLLDNVTANGGDLVPSTPEPNLTTFVTSRLTQVGMQLQQKLPNILRDPRTNQELPSGHKASLLRELRARPNANADVTRTLEAFLR